jgi:hypothetical protein
MKKILITFLIFILLFGSYLVKDSLALEPLTSSIVDYGDSSSVRLPGQDFGFYAAGRFWVFYDDTNEDFVYKTSLDGITWSNKIVLKAMTTLFGCNIVMVFDGTNVHYVRQNWYKGAYYRRGVPNSDGTITWAAEEQTVLDEATYTSVQDVSLIIDSGGYPWLGYQDQRSGGGYDPWVTKSSTNDGTWTTAASYPLKLNAEYNYWITKLVAQTNGKIYAIIMNYVGTQGESIIYGYSYDGANWGEKETVSTSKLKNGSTGGDFAMEDMVAIGDDIHLIFQSDSEDIRYIKRDGGTGIWGAEEILASTANRADKSSPTLTVWDENILLAFWIKKPVIYSVIQSNGVWQATTTPITFLTDNNIVLDQERCFQTWKKPTGGYGGLLYMPTISSQRQQTFVSYQYVAEEEEAPPAPMAVSFSNNIVLKDKVIIKN